MYPQVDCAESLCDEQVVTRVLEGEVELFELLVRRHGARLYRAALFILRDGAEAEDAVQDTYLNAYSHLAQFAGRARFSTWLLHIAMNNAWERMRRRKREIPTDIEDAKFQNLRCSAPDPETYLRRRELSALVAAELALMPLQYRQVLLLRDVWGIDTREAARCMQISESNVKVRLHRARRVLRNQLAEKDRCPPAPAGAVSREPQLPFRQDDGRAQWGTRPLGVITDRGLPLVLVGRNDDACRKHKQGKHLDPGFTSDIIRAPVLLFFV